MSYYMSWRFKCIIKEEYRKGFECIALRGEWDKSEIEELREYAEEFRLIPNARIYFPTEWDGCDKTDMPFETSWNEETGEWAFAISYNLYGEGSQIFEFDDVMEKYIEKIVISEYCGEDEKLKKIKYKK